MTIDSTQKQVIQECLVHLVLGLNSIEDLNTERNSLNELVNDLYHILVLEA